MALKIQLCPTLAADIEEPVFINDRTYILEPPMEDGKRNVWYGNTLIPYSIGGTIYDFMGSHPRCIKKPQVPRDFFLCYLSYKPLVFMDPPYDFSFFKNRVFHSSPPTENASYTKWLDRVQEKKEILMEGYGYFWLIQLFRVGPKYNSHMLIAAMCFWDILPIPFTFLVGW